MSAETFALVRTIKVGGYAVTFSLRQGKPGQTLENVIEWSPPRTGPLSDAELRAFRRGRNDVLAELAKVTGMAVEYVAPHSQGNRDASEVG